jgi:hypothetical protein
MSGESGSGEASDGGQDLVCGFGPVEGFGLAVMDSNELVDCGFQLLNASVRAALDLALGEECEPALDLVEPGGMRGGEVQMIPGAFL